MSSLNDSGEDKQRVGNQQATPCVRICRYNADFYDGSVCIGCFREVFEISNWASFTVDEKIYALQDALDRWQDEYAGSISRQELEQLIRNYESIRQSTGSAD